MLKFFLISFITVYTVLYLYKLYIDLRNTNRFIKNYESIRRGERSQ
jgi:hypothetical protein